MYGRSAAFALAQHGRETRPRVVLGLRTPAGRRLYAAHVPTLAEVGLVAAAFADGSWLADGSITAGEFSEPVLSLRSDLEKIGAIQESLQGSSGELLGLFSAGRASDLTVYLRNEPEPDGTRHFARLMGLAGEGLLGAQAEVSVNYPGLVAHEAMLRFSGRIRKVQLSRERVILTVRSV